MKHEFSSKYIRFGGNPNELPFTRYFLNQWAKQHGVSAPEDFEDAIKEIFKQDVYGSEADTETKIIRPVFELLGFDVLSEKQDIENIGQPDLVYYDSHENAKKKELSGILTIVESKAWSESLKAAHEKQIRNYVDLANSRSHQQVKWGILTNGKCWRLYKAGRRGFVEFDLEQLAESSVQLELARENNNNKSFHLKLFYTLFRKAAFENNGEFLNSIVEQSLQHQRDIETELHRQAYPALLAIFNGYWETINDDISKDEKEEKIKEVYEDSLYYLYRLLFVLFAEGRELQFCKKMPKSHRNLFDKLAHDAPLNYDPNSEKICIESWKDPFARDTATSISLPFLEIFEWLNKGNEYRNIPQFNGSLFEERPIDKVWIKDYYIGIALRLLKYNLRGASLDYSSLDIRHLGNIYERLLLFDVPKQGDTYDFYYQGIVGNGRKVTLKFPEEWVYFDVDPSERKSTGTYYTPDYIVKYIVENTVGEKLQEIMERPQRFPKPLRSILSLKILDPAMGSGHFLIRVIDEIASVIVANIGDIELIEPQMNIVSKPIDAAKGFGDITNLVSELIGEWNEFDDVQEKLKNELFWQRIVAKRCIYGVDLKPFAVELAKLAIWLHTLSEDEPLQFLDHHLRCGNSLIGVWDVSEIVHESTDKFKEFIQPIKNLVSISNLRDSNIDEVTQSQQLYDDAHQKLEKFISRLDVALAARNFMEFDDKETKKAIINQIEQAVERGEDHPRLKEAIQIAKEKRFFHWKVEFPEVWYSQQFSDGETEREDGGFDVVLGNPPYGADIHSEDKELIKEKFPHSKAYDSAEYFIELGEKLTKERLGFIIPKSFAFYVSWEGMRKQLLPTIENIADVGIAFADVNLEQIIIIANKIRETDFVTLSTTEKIKIAESSKELNLTGKIHKKLFFENDVIIFHPIDEIRQKIYEKINENSIRLLDLNPEIYRGIYISNKEKRQLKSGFIPFVHKQPSVKRYFVQADKIRYIEIPEGYEDKAEKILKSRLFMKVLRGSELGASMDLNGELLTTEKLVNIVLSDGYNYSIPFILAVINASISSKYIQALVFSEDTETARVMDSYYSGKIRIPVIYFVTPETELEQELTALKGLYQQESQSLMGKIGALLAENWQPDPEKVGEHNSKRIYEDFQIPVGEKWMRNDVTHKFLAYLAKEMSEFSNHKYLLELYSAGKIEAKSIEEAEVYDIFDKHSKEYSKKNARFLAKRYEKKFDKTDQLIDVMVCKLFGLTNREVEILKDPD